VPHTAGRVAGRIRCQTTEQSATDQAAEESRAISERVHVISTVEELQRELDAGRDRLVVVEVMADNVCETGLIEPDDGWSPDRAEKEAKKLAVCEGIKHSFMRMAADSRSARFLEVLVRLQLLHAKCIIDCLRAPCLCQPPGEVTAAMIRFTTARR
jgi:hypothetical protein